MRPLKVVFDTNILLAAIIKPKGYAAQYVWESGLRRRFSLYCSLDILAELRGKVIKTLPDKLAYANQLIAYIQLTGEIINPDVHVTKLKDEPDNRILECAASCEADLIVSFDKHLLALKKYGSAAIIHPSLLQDYFPR